MKSYIPILAAFVGAAFGSLLGAYFTFVSKKRERVWSERFSVLKEIIEILGIIKEAYDVEHMDSMGVKTVGDEEREALISLMNSSKIKLRENSASLRILFKSKNLRYFEAYRQGLNEKFGDMFHIKPHENLTDFIEDIYESADLLQKETIKIAEKFCL